VEIQQVRPSASPQPPPPRAHEAKAEPARTPQGRPAGVDGIPASPVGVDPTIHRDEQAGVDVVEFRVHRSGEVVCQLPTKAVLELRRAARAASDGRKEVSGT
jgi:hypothetical protein